MSKVILKCFTSLLIIASVRSQITNNRYYPKYHLAPPKGWMNDPNGFCFYKGEYHLFYQHNPDSSEVPGIAHWGHAKSKDLFSWEHLPIAMYPDETYDKTGVFSGSAVVEGDNMYLFYTGNVNENEQQQEYQALAISTDGETFQKYSNNPIIDDASLQPNIRDPKVWKHGDTYYMVLGNSIIRDSVELGRILLYASTDRIHWEQKSVLDESDGFLGYMFECPDFFEINGLFVLLFSPQGVSPQGDKYKNLYQTGYKIGLFDYVSYKFVPLTDFEELDHGHDFYATQTILDPSGRRVLVAWLDMWETDYAEKQDGWFGQMSIPRVLTISNNLKVLQTPVKEIVAAEGVSLYSGIGSGGQTVVLTNNAAEVRIQSQLTRNLDVLIVSSSGTVTISYNYAQGLVSLNRGGDDGLRRTEWRPRGKLQWRLYIDSSSIELFCGKGEVTFSSRFFPTGTVSVQLGSSSYADSLRVLELKNTVQSS